MAASANPAAGDAYSLSGATDHGDSVGFGEGIYASEALTGTYCNAICDWTRTAIGCEAFLQRDGWLDIVSPKC